MRFLQHLESHAAARQVHARVLHLIGPGSEELEILRRILKNHKETTTEQRKELQEFRTYIHRTQKHVVLNSY